MKKSPKFAEKNSESIHLDLSKLQIGKYFRKTSSNIPTTRSQNFVTLPDSFTISNGSNIHKKGGASLAIPSLRLNEGPLTTREDLKIKIPKIEKMFSPQSQTPFTARSNYVEKKEWRGKKIELWESILNIREHFEKCPFSTKEVPVAGKPDLSRIFKVLRLLQETDSDMEGVMDPLIASLKSLIYVNPKAIQMYYNEEIFKDDIDFKKLLLVFQQPNFTYHGACNELIRLISSKNIDARLMQEDYSSQIQELHEIITDKDRAIEDLKQKLESTISDGLYQNAVYRIEEMKEEHKTLLIGNKQLQVKVRELGEENGLLKNRYSQGLKQIENCEDYITVLKEEKKGLISDSECSKDTVNMMHNKVKGLKDIMDKVLVRLAIIKQEIVELRQQNLQLENENRKLGVRAARGFEDLTPRPNYQVLQEEKEIELNIYDPSGKTQLVSTSDIFNKLVEEIHDLRKKLQERPPERPHLSIIKTDRHQSSRNIRLSQAEAADSPLRSSKTMPRRERGSSINTGGLKLNINKNSENRSTPYNEPGSAVVQRPSVFFPDSKPDTSQHSDEGSSPSATEEPVNSVPVIKPIPKSRFANSKPRIEFAQTSVEREFGAETLENAQEIMQDVVQAKNYLKELF